MPQHTPLELSRRNFLGRAGAVVAGLSALNVSALALAGCSSEATPAAPQAASEAPKVLTWNTVITAKDEPGRPLLVSGRIYGPDGKTPLEGVTLYVYHTDNTGLYPGDGINPAPRLRGWMKTDREGRYEFRTIKPASYPNSSNPEHVHTKASGRGLRRTLARQLLVRRRPAHPLRHAREVLRSGRLLARHGRQARRRRPAPLRPRHQAREKLSVFCDCFFARILAGRQLRRRLLKVCL